LSDEREDVFLGSLEAADPVEGESLGFVAAVEDEAVAVVGVGEHAELGVLVELALVERPDADHDFDVVVFVHRARTRSE